MQKHAVKILAIILLVSLLPACGGGSSSPGSSTDSSSPSSSPGTVSRPQVSADGETVQVEITTEGGAQLDVTASSGMLEDFPLPVYPEWTVMSAAKADMSNGFRWNAAFQFTGDIGELTQRYASELESLGYEAKIIELGQDMRGIEVRGTLDGKPVDGLISIGKAGDMQVININFGDPM